MSSKPNRISNVTEKIFYVFFQKKQISVIFLTFFSWSEATSLSGKQLYQCVGLINFSPLLVFYILVFYMVRLILVLAIFLEEELKILGQEWSSTFQCSPDYDILCESLHILFQHAYATVHTKRNISSLNFYKFWVNSRWYRVLLGCGFVHPV